MSSLKRSVYERMLKQAIARALCAGVGAAGLMAALGASEAAADDTVPFGDVGAFLGWTWGPGGGFLWGIEGRLGFGLRDQFGCDAQPAPGPPGATTENTLCILGRSNAAGGSASAWDGQVICALAQSISWSPAA